MMLDVGLVIHVCSRNLIPTKFNSGFVGGTVLMPDADAGLIVNKLLNKI
jgi:hypothetical protein